MSVRLVVDVRIKPGSRDELLSAYAALRGRVTQEPGLIAHQLCESSEDSERWLVLSEWESVELSNAWNASEDHARLLAPLRACFAQASRSSFHVRDGAVV
ncbi:MAG TPA: antibiotic biosynthesis monooxygenase family protein [Solirubrobacteraceae bacterium]|jgi:heme-degrading monooxygenase HmoA|nr:antibiotic biosynthesis monooxygenase family protein [Solirubrobacteraceae bacterium]